MAAEKWLKVKEIFNAAVELSPAERAAFLDNQKITDNAVRAQIEQLLKADEEDAIEETPVVSLPQLLRGELGENFIGKQIGAYKIVREIGRGGMGVVFEAVREGDDFSQKVALKLLKKGLETNQMLGRFRQERKILASLEHPNIARLLDGGMTEDGTPFFALEFVAGLPIDEYCRAKNLSVNERLQLFKQICAAVSFAHSRLVVHRDLKPSNVLVTDDGTVKLLDFGIAKIISDENSASDGTVTKLGMMTPAYASPEQISSGLVTTSSDVYSLGLILYELLANRPAYEFPSQRADEIARVICEVEPAAPSKAIADFGVRNANLKTDKFLDLKRQTNGNQTKTNPQSEIRNSKSLRGDLDNIVLKALKKAPARRYASVEQFSEDLERHLKGLPVIARPDTLSYRFERFVARNRFAVLGGLLLVLSLVGGIAATSWQAVRAERERVRAEKRFDQVRQLANAVVFKYYDPIASLSGATEVKNMMIKDATDYLDALSEDAGTNPGLKYELALAYFKLADVQGKVYTANVGDPRGALENYRKSIVLLEQLVSTPNVEKKDEITDKLILAYQTLGTLRRRNFAHQESFELQEKALQLILQRNAAAPSAQTRFGMIRGYVRVGDSLSETGDFESYQKYFRQALPIAEELVQAEPEKVEYVTALGIVNDRIGRFSMLRAVDLARIPARRAEAAALYQTACPALARSLDVFAKVLAKKPDDAKYIRNHNVGVENMALCLSGQGEHERALQLALQSVTTFEKIAANDNADKEAKTDYAEGLDNYSNVLLQANRAAETIPLLQKSIAITDKLLADDGNLELYKRHFHAMTTLGDAFLAVGRFDEAAETYQKAFEKVEKIYGEKFPPMRLYAEGFVADRLGDVRFAQNKRAEAAAEYQKALDAWRKPEARESDLSRAPEQIEWTTQKLADAHR